ncbi:MAG: hypothetical protein CVT67_09660 [Actinobacteria bacterium HGW-Actinobacteria-7]|jgi:RimJ/RimL family protein N-acetyltransferase|nr:MAG: hypothetical protein CVT67_09660 [Actinobacteria bacterium HGW-Actinobacteria-7]
MLYYPELTDGTISLRAWSLDDVPVVHRMVQDPEIPRFLSIPPNHTIENVSKWIAGRDADLATGRSVSLAITDVGDGRLLGSVSLELSCADDAIGEIGYWIAAEERGRGIASAAVTLIEGWAFETLGLGRLEITTHPENQTSQRVALANGFREEGVLRAYRLHHGKRVDLVMFSKLPGDTRD